MRIGSNMATGNTLRIRLAGALTVLLLIAAACGGGTGPDRAADGPDEPATPDTESDAEPTDLSGTSVTLATVGFTENFILTQITKTLLEEAGADVDITDLPAQDQARQALLAGEVDAYWAYTGTGWTVVLGHEDVPDVTPMELYEMVAEEDLEKNGVRWLPPAGFNNTYAIAVSSETAQEIDVEKLSDLAEYTRNNPDQMGLCVDTTFSDREDGLIALERTYDFEWPADQITVSDYALVYPSVDKADPCRFGEVYTTDGRVAALDLKILEDDQGAFISYLPSLIMMEDTYEQIGERVEQLLAPVVDALDEDTMTQLNARVDVDGEFPEDVAHDWLIEQGLLE